MNVIIERNFYKHSISAYIIMNVIIERNFISALQALINNIAQIF